MSILRSILLIALIASASPVLAQDAIERQMTPEEFKAAGLDKLSAEELSRLNAWLNRKIDTETTKAAAQAQDKVKSETRGFFNFGSNEPIVSTLNGEFRGFARGRNYALANGQEWEQIDEASLVGVRKANPGVKVTPSIVGNVWYLAIDGYSTRAKVRRVK